MFTGLIEEVGVLRSFSPAQGILRIQAKHVLEGTKIGDSIAVNGVCLTVTQMASDGFTADVMPETLRRSSLGTAKIGSLVNLERALAVGSRLDGHIVSGHIDGTGRIRSLRPDGNALLLTVVPAENLLHQIAEKGSVALDGISLTVASVARDAFSVSLIPHTRTVTNLQDKRLGDLLNIETDILAKYVERLLTFADKKTRDKCTAEFLLQQGF